MDWLAEMYILNPTLWFKNWTIKGLDMADVVII